MSSNETETEEPKSEFSALDFQIALDLLDLEIGNSKNLKKAGPIRIMTFGGFIAVTYLRNRDTTNDIDYLLDPTLPNVRKLEVKLRKAIQTVSEMAHYSTKWANDNLGVYAAGERRVHLFNDTVAQNIVVYRGKHLIVYAGQWEWILDRKLKRIILANREDDLEDSVAILKVLTDKAGGPISKITIKSWYFNLFEQIPDEVFEQVGTRFKLQFGIEGLST